MNPNIRLSNHTAGRDREGDTFGKPYGDCVLTWICHEHGPETP